MTKNEVSKLVYLPSVSLGYQDIEELFSILCLEERDYEGRLFKRYPSVHVHNGNDSHTFRDLARFQSFLLRNKVKEFSLHNSVYCEGSSYSIHVSFSRRLNSLRIDGPDDVWLYGKLEKTKKYISSFTNYNSKIRKFLNFATIFAIALLIAQGAILSVLGVTEAYAIQLGVGVLYASSILTGFLICLMAANSFENVLFPMVSLRHGSSKNALKNFVLWTLGGTCINRNDSRCFFSNHEFIFWLRSVEGPFVAYFKIHV